MQAELDARRAGWALSLDQLAQYTDSLEKELIKMASNMRRSRTEILHLSVRWAHLCFLHSGFLAPCVKIGGLADMCERLSAEVCYKCCARAAEGGWKLKDSERILCWMIKDNLTVG